MNYTDTSHRQLGKFDNPITQRVMDDLDKRIVELQDSRYLVGGVLVLAVNHKPGWGW